MYVCMYVYVCMHTCMYAYMYVIIFCLYVCAYVVKYVCCQNRHANTMSLGEWRWPVLATCAVRPSNARRPSCQQPRRQQRLLGPKRATRASATLATQSEGRCRQVPRLPRQQPRRQRRQLGPERATSASPLP